MRRWTVSGFVLFLLAGGVRSNSLLLAAFLLPKFTSRAPHDLFTFFKQSIPRGLLALVLLLPAWLYQRYGMERFCAVLDRPYCHTALPSLYSFIQSFYWDVGPFRYYRVSQIPNFLLAAPVLFLSFYGIVVYGRTLWVGKFAATGLHQLEVFLFWCYLVAQAASAVVFVHIQVTTRFLASSPLLFWAAAEFVLRASPRASRWRARALAAYVVGFAVVGTVLFSAFYPWT